MSARVLGAVLRRQLADQRRTVLLWGLSLGAMGAFMAAIFPSIQDALSKLVKSYPSGLIQAFGVGDLSTVEGYVHAEMFSVIVPLAIGYLAVRSMANPIAAGEESGYLDTLLTLPLPRRLLMASTFLSAAVVSAGVLLLTGLLTFVSGRIAGTGIALDRTLEGVLGAWALAVFAAGVAAAACGALHHGRSVIGIGMGTLVAMYAVDVAGRLSGSVEFLRNVSAFRYYGAPLRDGLDTGGFFLLLAVGAALAAVGVALFRRRDILR